MNRKDRDNNYRRHCETRSISPDYDRKHTRYRFARWTCTIFLFCIAISECIKFYPVVKFLAVALLHVEALVMAKATLLVGHLLVK